MTFQCTVDHLALRYEKKMSADHCGDLAALAGWLFTI